MNKYNSAQIEKMLSSMTIIVDSREQDTDGLRRRTEGFSCPSVRRKLDYGDYSTLYYENGTEATLERVAAIERKMSIDELCNCFTSGRERFKREFERAKVDGCHIHLIVEGGSYEKIIAHKYHSKLLPKSLIASLFSWSVRYNMQLHFCKPEVTGKLIREILHYELREHLINQCADVAV